MKKLVLAEWKSFLSTRFIGLYTLSIVIALALSFVEVAFAFGLQAFLVVAQIAPAGNVQLLSWIPVESLIKVSIFLSIAALLRGVLQWGQEYLRIFSYELFRYIHSSRIIRWTFQSTTASSADVSYGLSTRVNLAGEGMMNAQQTLLFGTMSLFLFVWMLWISWKMTAFTFLFAALLYPLLRYINRHSSIIGKSLATLAQKVNARLLMSIHNLLLLRIYNLQKKEERISQAYLGEYLDQSMRFANINSINLALPQILGTVMICSITWFMTHKVGTSGGMLLSFFYLFFRFSQNSTVLLGSLSRATLRKSEMMEMFGWWQRHYRDLPPAVEVVPSEAIVDLTAVGWKLKNITFKYPGADQPVFKSFNLNILPGQSLVVTGPSGVGKSTLIYLLVGELKPDSGEVLALVKDRLKPVSQILSPLLKNIGYVGSESFIFEGTVLENICYGLDHSPSKQEIDRALFDAECLFVNDLPSRLDHRLTEQGQGLSAGQKQRLSLTRALLRNPKALILDEATSNLDSETEARLIQRLLRLKGKMTLVVITHRTSLLKLADQHLDLRVKSGMVK